MASRLTFVADATKKGGIVLAIGIVIFLIGRVLVKKAIELATPPPPKPTPIVTAIFGILPAPVFPEDVKKTAGVTIKLETISGTIPEGTPTATIHRLVEKKPALGFEAESRRIAGEIGFRNTEPVKISDTVYLFQDPADTNKKLEMDFAHYNINFAYDNMPSYIAFQAGVTPTIETATTTAFNYLNTIRKKLIEGNITSNYDPKIAAVGTYAYFNPTTLEVTEVPSQQQANLTKLNIYRKPVDGIQIVGPSTTESLINLTYTGISSTSDPRNFSTRLVEAHLTDWEVDPSSTASYPLKTPTQAYNELQQGNGYILNTVTQGDIFNIRRIYLGYYMPATWQPYLLPVWVFEGDKETDLEFKFKAVVPAPANGYIKP